MQICQFMKECVFCGMFVVDRDADADADGPWVALANTLLGLYGLPKYVRKLSDCQPFMLVSLIERMFNVKLGKPFTYRADLFY